MLGICGNRWFASQRASKAESHDDVIKWKHFPRYWPSLRGHKGQWRGALMFSLLCAGTNGSVNNGNAGDLRRHRTDYNGTVMAFSYHGAYVMSFMWWNRPYIIEVNRRHMLSRNWVIFGSDSGSSVIRWQLDTYVESLAWKWESVLAMSRHNGRRLPSKTP